LGVAKNTAYNYYRKTILIRFLLRDIIEHLKNRKKDLNHIDKQMKKTGASQVSLTDPDSRSMPVGRGHHTEVGYNVQMTVDSKHKLILEHEVTNDVTDPRAIWKI
jgi:transposase